MSEAKQESEHVWFREVDRGEDVIVWCPKSGAYEQTEWTGVDWMCSCGFIQE